MHPHRVTAHPSNRRRLSTYKPSQVDPVALLRPAALHFYVWPVPEPTPVQAQVQPPAPSVVAKPPASSVKKLLPTRLPAHLAPPTPLMSTSSRRTSAPPPSRPESVRRSADARRHTLEPEESIPLLESVRGGQRPESPPPASSSLSKRPSALPIRRVTLKMTLVHITEEEELPFSPGPSNRKLAKQKAQSQSVDTEDESSEEEPNEEELIEEDRHTDKDQDEEQEDESDSVEPPPPPPQKERPSAKGKA